MEGGGEDRREDLRLLRVPLLSQFLATKAVIDEGLLGKLHYGEVDYYHGIGPWYGQYPLEHEARRLGGSALLTAGCHALDALLLCMGTRGRGGHELTPRRARTPSSRLRIPTRQRRRRS